MHGSPCLTLPCNRAMARLIVRNEPHGGAAAPYIPPRFVR
jgi:hypothetical protein